MDGIKSIYKDNIVSKANSLEITSKTSTNIQSKSNVCVVSDIEAAAERAAFLATAKKNASMMFSKYL